MGPKMYLYADINNASFLLSGSGESFFFFFFSLPWPGNAELRSQEPVLIRADDRGQQES